MDGTVLVDCTRAEEQSASTALVVGLIQNKRPLMVELQGPVGSAEEVDALVRQCTEAVAKVGLVLRKAMGPSH